MPMALKKIYKNIGGWLALLTSIYKIHVVNIKSVDDLSST